MCRAPCAWWSGPALERLFAPYVDERDAGLAVLTHSYLLLGCALPLWLHLPLFSDYQWRALQQNCVPALAGVLVLGVGDSMVRAPLTGRPPRR